LVVIVTLAIDPHYLVTAPLFPIGLAGLLPNGHLFIVQALFPGWLIYIILSLALFRTRTCNGFLIIFLVLCLLLILNLAGCQHEFHEFENPVGL